jgi:D-alanyl-D-alanine dipeptidase
VLQQLFIFSKVSVLIVFLLTACTPKPEERDKAFVELSAFLPELEIDLRYFGKDNFLGDTINGYEANKCFLTEEAAKALQKVMVEVAKDGYVVKVFDAYRPQSAVDHFMKWAKDPSDTLMKWKYYPELKKERLFPEGYIVEHSGHSRGSTIDLTLVYAVGKLQGEELDMGSPWDYFGERSWIEFQDITEEQKRNRAYLQSVMIRNGFIGLKEEWWHFTLEDEPFKDTYFDFPIR